MTIISHHLLIDASCSLVGYVEDVCGNLALDSEQIAIQCHRFGVGAVRDTGSGIAAKSRFVGSYQNVKVAGGTIAITDCAPMSRSEIVVTTSSQLDAAVSLCQVLGEQWIGVRSDHPDFFHAVHAATAPLGIAICGRGSGVFDAVLAGDVRIIDGIASLLPLQTSPIGALVSAATAPSATWLEYTDALAEQEVGVCTGLVALRRAVFLKEAIQAPYLDDLASIVPHSQYLHRMRQGAGYLAGKRALEAHSGMREPTGKERHALNEGWARVTEWICTAAQAGVVFLPASKAPQLAVLPGYGLLEELALLAHLGISTDDVITMATTVTAHVFGVEPIPGKLAVHERFKPTTHLESNQSLRSVLTRDSLLSVKPVI